MNVFLTKQREKFLYRGSSLYFLK